VDANVCRVPGSILDDDRPLDLIDEH
jgi:hypothetical protein